VPMAGTVTNKQWYIAEASLESATP